MLQNPQVLLTSDKVHDPLRLPRETTSEPPKVARTCGALYILTSECAWRQNSLHFFDTELPKVVRTPSAFHILTWKCASRHNSVHFFDISTSKSGPNPSGLYTFDFEMCYAPQRRALFRHLNFQKWSEHGVLCTFWLGNVLSATTACNFPSLIWPAGSAPAALASLLFDPPEPQIIGKTQWIATFLPFRASASSFFWLFLFYHLLSSALLFSLPLPISAFHLSILWEIWLLNFLRLIFCFCVLFFYSVSSFKFPFSNEHYWSWIICLLSGSSIVSSCYLKKQFSLVIMTHQQ